MLLLDGAGSGLLEAKYQIARLDTSHGRAYYEMGAQELDRHYMYGVTSVLDGALSKGVGYSMWLGNAPSYSHAMDYAMEKADDGTCVHAMADYLNHGLTLDTEEGWYNERKNKKFIITDRLKSLLEGYIKFIKEHEPKMIASEITLYNPKRFKNKYAERYRFPFAGTADIVCDMVDKKGDTRTALIDIKTGKEYPKSHELQLTAYKILFDSLHGSDVGKIDDIYCLYLKSTGNYKLVKYHYQPEVWYMVLDLFHYMISNKAGKMPVIKEKEAKPRYYTLEQEQELEKDERDNTTEA